jgi:rubrerythrin
MARHADKPRSLRGRIVHEEGKEMMTLDQAIRSAIELENKVHKSYAEAEKRAKDPVGQRVFHVLAEEEQGHIAYLESRLAEWKKSGHVTAAILKSTIPERSRIKDAASKVSRQVKAKEDTSTEVQLLQKALGAEQETSAFYRRMVSELDPEGQGLFSRFIEIEEGHVAIVQAEIQSLTGSGFWFDMQEFQLEAE